MFGASKIMVYRDFEICEDGVTPVWAWLCPERECWDKNVEYGSSLYWENAVRGASHHVAFHRARAVN